MILRHSGGRTFAGNRTPRVSGDRTATRRVSDSVATAGEHSGRLGQSWGRCSAAPGNRDFIGFTPRCWSTRAGGCLPKNGSAAGGERALLRDPSPIKGEGAHNLSENSGGRSERNGPSGPAGRTEACLEDGLTVPEGCDRRPRICRGGGTRDATRVGGVSD